MRARGDVIINHFGATDTEQTIDFIINNVLKDWLVFNIEQDSEDYIVVSALYTLPVWYCPHCEIVDPHLTKYGKKSQIISPTDWLKVHMIRQRYQCGECGTTFWEPITFRLVRQQKVVGKSFRLKFQEGL